LEASVLNGLRPQEGEEKKSTTQLTIHVPDSVAIELRRRVKAMCKRDPYFSRNDLVRKAINEYFARHPFNGGAA
jgi:hypothetical protein